MSSTTVLFAGLGGVFLGMALLYTAIKIMAALVKRMGDHETRD